MADGEEEEVFRITPKGVAWLRIQEELELPSGPRSYRRSRALDELSRIVAESGHVWSALDNCGPP